MENLNKSEYSVSQLEKMYSLFKVFYLIGVPLSLILIGIPMVITAVVFHAIILYRAWKIIPSEFRRTTPGKAVGFCFIPIFAYYWYFQAYVGLSTDMTNFQDKFSIGNERISRGMSISSAILFVCFLIPYLDILVLIPMLIMFFLITKNIHQTTIQVVKYLNSIDENNFDPKSDTPPPLDSNIS